MTLEEAEVKLLSMLDADGNSAMIPFGYVDNLIGKIYRDFESRTCEHCAHFYEPDITRNICKCKLGIVSISFGTRIVDGEVDDTFGCNKFERKE
jgi:hypothetical protein